MMKVIFMAFYRGTAYRQAIDVYGTLAPMRNLLHTEFKTLVGRAGLTQAELARLAGYTVQQVNAWCRGRSVAPRWALLLLLALQEIPVSELEARAEDEEFEWYEVLGVPPGCDRAVMRRAMARLGGLHHPDKGGDKGAMQRVNAAYEQGLSWR